MDKKMFEMALVYGAYNYDDATFIKSYMFETKEELTVARHPLQKLLINVDIDLKEHDMMRKVK